ncbi:hypothetical protein RvY_01224 [Ramazzottius varieornatus]|uniref:Uncharacterized protein n=1 Tax=Ramazzottius varieornatus TaxID=947166 RepID=A0A1D1UGF8_RAMVA|nr:hypothetical protein RvY_01224 [Ramazzottius varieornatus]
MGRRNFSRKDTMSTSRDFEHSILCSTASRSSYFPSMNTEHVAGRHFRIPPEFADPHETTGGHPQRDHDDCERPIRRKYYMSEEKYGGKPLPGYQFPLRYEGGENSLFHACEQDHVDVVIRLIAHGVDPNRRKDGYHQMHIIHVTAAHGAIEVLSYLLTKFAEEFSYKPSQLANLVDAEGSTALHWALQKRWKKCCILLLQNGARIDLAQISGFLATPVCIACSQGLVDILELMWTHSPGEFTNSLAMADDDGFLPIHLAAVMNALPVLTLLIDKGADPNAPDSEGRTSVLLSAASGAWSTVKLLVTSGARPFQADRMGRTIIHLGAILGSFPEQNTALATADLCAIKEEVAKHVNDKDSLGCTALHYAAAYGNLEVFRHLVQKGANIKIRSAENKSVLHYAAQYGASALIRMLLMDNEYDVSYMINLSDNRGMSLFRRRYCSLTPVCSFWGTHRCCSPLGMETRK